MRDYESTTLLYLLLRNVLDARYSNDVNTVPAAIESSEMILTLLARECPPVTTEAPVKRRYSLDELVSDIICGLFGEEEQYDSVNDGEVFQP